MISVEVFVWLARRHGVGSTLPALQVVQKDGERWIQRERRARGGDV